MYARQSQCGLSWGYGTSLLAGTGRGARLPDRLSTPSDTMSDVPEQPQGGRSSLRGRTPGLASMQEPSSTMERLPHAPCPASAPLRRVSGAGEALGCASFVCGEGGSTEIALLLWQSIRPLGTHMVSRVWRMGSSEKTLSIGQVISPARPWNECLPCSINDWILVGTEEQNVVTEKFYKDRFLVIYLSAGPGQLQRAA